MWWKSTGELDWSRSAMSSQCSLTRLREEVVTVQSIRLDEHTLALCQLVKEVQGAAIEDAGSQDAVPQTLTRSEDENYWDVKKKQNLTI